MIEIPHIGINGLNDFNMYCNYNYNYEHGRKYYYYQSIVYIDIYIQSTYYMVRQIEVKDAAAKMFHSDV